MASYVTKNAQIFLNEFDITGFLNSVALNYASDVQENTVFGNSTRSRVAGLLDASVDINGYWEADSLGNPDLEFFTEVGAATRGIVSVAPNTAAENDRAFSLLFNQANYNHGAAIGEVAPFDINVQSGAPLIRGLIGGVGQKIATGNSANIVLPAVGVNDTLFASAHIIHNGGSTPTIDIVVKSDADGSFPAGETTRLTFAQVTTSSSFQQLSNTDTITDTFYRVEWTLSGSSPDYNIFVVLGVVPKL